MKENKLTISGTDNNGYRHRYSFDKNSEFKEAFINLMTELEFEKEKIGRYFYWEEENEDGEEIIVNLDISNLSDVVWFFQNKKYEVDTFIGVKKVIIVIRTKERDELIKKIIDKTKWIPEERMRGLEKEKIKEIEVN